MSDAISRLNEALEGRYHIERKLGEGGMATVYLADDLKHERKVALKVLKPELAAVVGADRFLAEIKTTANLQHPHILPLHDSGEADGLLYYVMPFVKGESLRNRLDREQQLPVDDAVRVATNLAEALDYAHRQGVIHRDIKPANVMLLDGKPVISDFGIALAVSAGGGGRLTETGLSLGTPHYMSPEQATGDQGVGPATDIYALGCVLYEMLVGEPPFTGSTPQAVLGKIITGATPSAKAERSSVPPNVDAAIAKVLEKIPADRFDSGSAFVKALADPAFRHGDAAAGARDAESGLWKPAAIGFALTSTVLATLMFSMIRDPDPGTVGVAERFEAPFRVGEGPSNASPGSFALSRDASLVVYRGRGQSGVDQLWLRRLEDPAATPIPGTEGGRQPAVSWDGSELAFTQSGAVKVVALEGGPITTALEGAWPVWGPEGTLYASQEGQVVRAAASGMPPERVTQPRAREAYRMTAVLPDGARALVTVRSPDAAAEVRVLNLASGEMEALVQGERARYMQSGFLVYHTPSELRAARFDIRTGRLGPSEVILTGMWGTTVSESGSLFYAAALERGLHSPVRVDRSGRATEIEPGWQIEAVENETTLALSPDGTRLVVAHSQGDAWPDLWVHELEGGTRFRLTTSPAWDARPSWHPSGASILFVSNRSGEADELWEIPSTGGAAQLRVAHPESGARQGEYTPEGDRIVYRAATTTNGGNPGIFVRALGDTLGQVVTDEDYTEWDPAVSPDGAWLAYASNRTGRSEVYVTRLSDATPQALVSRGGGREPRWAGSTQELFYRSGDEEMVAVRYEVVDGAFTVVDRVPLFRAAAYLSAVGIHSYDVSADGESFYMFRAASGVPFRRTRLVLHLDRELEQVLPR